ncbi:MAG: hypothetical protein MZW92_03670 [Comamonadaceae bacterium]|nr:hypothetical protein [Comamonadaceae bacterium]
MAERSALKTGLGLRGTTEDAARPHATAQATAGQRHRRPRLEPGQRLARVGLHAGGRGAGSEMKILVIVVGAALAGILLFLLASASANTALFSRHYPLLLALNGAVTIVLLGLVLVQLRKLYREYRARVFGSRLTYRLLLAFAVMGVAAGPDGLWRFGAVRGAQHRNLVRRAGGRGAGRRHQSRAQRARLPPRRPQGQGAQHGARPFRGGRPRQPDAQPPARADRHRFGHVVHRLRTGDRQQFGRHRRAAPGHAQCIATAPGSRRCRACRRGRRCRDGPHAEGAGAGERIAARCRDPGAPAHPEGAGATRDRMPKRVQAVYRDYQELSLARHGLQAHLRRDADPHPADGPARRDCRGDRAEPRGCRRRCRSSPKAPRRWPQGDFSRARRCPARDELGVLTQSFNRMTRQLDDARALAERAPRRSWRAHAPTWRACWPTCPPACWPSTPAAAARREPRRDRHPGRRPGRFREADAGRLARALHELRRSHPRHSLADDRGHLAAADRDASATIGRRRCCCCAGRACPGRPAADTWSCSTTSRRSISGPARRPPGARWRGAWRTRSRTR